MPATTYLTSAIVLRSTDFRDTSKILSLLTHDLGKVDVIAKGARKNLKQFSGGLGPFTIMQTHIRESRGDLWQLQSTKVQTLFSGILKSYIKVKMGSLAIEWMRKTLSELKPESTFFLRAKDFFEILDVCEDSVLFYWVLGFASQWMDALGFSPQVHQCGVCRKDAPISKPAYFDIELGALQCRQCSSKTLDHRRQLFLISSHDRQLITRFLSQTLLHQYEEKSENENPEQFNLNEIRNMLCKFIPYHTRIDESLIRDLLSP